MGLKLVGEVSLDGSGFEAGLNKLEHAAGHFGHTLKGVALEAFGIYTIEQAFAKTLETAKELVIESKRLGVGVEGLQVLRQAAKENNVEMTSLAKAFEKVDVAREKALGKSKEGKALLGRFGQLGISESDLRSKTAANLFMGQMHDKASSMNPETLGPILKSIMGKGFGEMIPMLTTDFEELQKKMEKFGAIMTTETALKLKQFSDEMELASQVIIAQLAPAMVSFAEAVLDLVGRIKEMAGFVGTMVGSRGGVSNAVMDEGRYRRLLGQSELAEGMGMTTPGETRSRGLFRGDAHVPDAEERAFMDKYETDLGKAGQVALDAQDDWKSSVEAWRKKIEEEADKLRHPPTPDFGGNPDEAAESKHRRQSHMGEDSMIRIGGFLGSNVNSMESIANQQVDLLKVIAVNTRPGSSGGGTTTGYPPG